MLEDDVVCGLAHLLREADSIVLAEGANQGAAFRFKIRGRIKAPDLVAFKSGILFVGEGKIHGRSLFATSLKRPYSDFDSMAYISDNLESRQQLRAEAATRLSTLGLVQNPNSVSVLPFVFATDGLTKMAEIAVARKVALIQCAVDLTKVDFIAEDGASTFRKLLLPS